MKRLKDFLGFLLWRVFHVMTLDVVKACGGLVPNLAAALHDFSLNLGGAWSMTLTPDPEDARIVEVHVLRVRAVKPAWKGPGMKQPRQDAKAEALIETRLVFKGSAAEVVEWMKRETVRLVKEEKERKEQIEKEQKAWRDKHEAVKK